jgi:hypothetical protein
VVNEPAKVLAVNSNLQWTSGCFAGIFPLVQPGTPPLQPALLTPAMVSYHQTAFVLEQRQTVLDAAYGINPERFVRQAPKQAAVPTEVWINKPINTSETH